eukprot:CAMPEP_0174300314 /NCGR_PEP_ID=MMETSP0809-20121228/58393_1 /TAXON_ID=73025 ORGANISM="Eutreptiella gymnastica-like, Strain CCMP1594" /NCGR_SAMPLE_ID=MMETSP0809 /ASSEMBLY_ACC=CAM_ASM_000658 /LENGTH=182 /DNA_ID=CAMNT_0015405875 /DNA_START=76 /DNA_END=625 /DNA_ORIENTATION=+
MDRAGGEGPCPRAQDKGRMALHRMKLRCTGGRGWSPFVARLLGSGTRSARSRVCALSHANRGVPLCARPSRGGGHVDDRRRSAERCADIRGQRRHGVVDPRRGVGFPRAACTDPVYGAAPWEGLVTHEWAHAKSTATAASISLLLFSQRSALGVRAALEGSPSPFGVLGGLMAAGAACDEQH